MIVGGLSKMKILIVGGGISGCSIARLLKDKGHSVRMIEKRAEVGGLCITRMNKEGLKYEPYGARTFHTKNKDVIRFVKKFAGFNDYVHRKGVIIKDALFPFPITKECIRQLEEYDMIKKELESRPLEIDKRNFETAAKSMFGETLYRLFIENYTKKMWGVHPSILDASWAPKRLQLKKNETPVFEGEWQGLPKGGYSGFLSRMIRGIAVETEKTSYDASDYDLVISTSPIDEVFGLKLGRLDYRSMEFVYKNRENWEDSRFGTINLPQDASFIRKCNFSILHQQETNNPTIQYQTPKPAKEENIPMYPVNTKINEEKLEKYIRMSVRTNIVPFGRLGLFQYINMDTAIENSLYLSENLQQYKNNPAKRINILRKMKTDV